MASLFERALKLALTSHWGQKDKQGKPYILHPLRVSFRFEEEILQVIALLHDVLEDTPLTLEDLREFPKEVCQAVQCLTKQKGEKYSEYLERVASHPLARKVKLADIEDNIQPLRLPKLLEEDWERIRRYWQAWHFLKKVEEKNSD